MSERGDHIVNQTQFDIAMVGHFAVDRITAGGETIIASGGAVYYGAMALARLGYRVAVITRLHPDDFGRLDELQAAGISVFATAATQTAGMHNIYHTADRDKRACKPLGFAGPFTEADLPDIEAAIYLVIPILAGEVDLETLKAIAARGPVGLDVQGFVRFADGDDVVFRDWREKREGLRYVHRLKVDDTEAEVLTGKTDRKAAALELASYGPKEVLLTHGKGVLVYSDGTFYRAAFTPRRILGRTGRGDTCFSTYCAKRLTLDPQAALRYAAVVTSLKMEDPGPFARSTDEVERWIGQT
jgi:sugar/nucleoside kinase (ribokinase family)